MTTLILPLEMIVEYGDKGYSHPNCPVCEEKEFQLQLTPRDTIQLYCDNDNFALRNVGTERMEARFETYAYNDLYNVRRQEKFVHKLYKKGLISFMVFEEELQFMYSELEDKEENVLKCENSNCEEPRTTTVTTVNMFLSKTIGVCAVCKMDIGTDL